MKIYTHILGGILFFISFAYLMNLNGIIIGTFFAAWISILPDVIDRLAGKHRGIGHSIIWIIPFVTIGFFNFLIGSALIIGFLSHIFFDSLTRHGTPFFYPFSKVEFVSLNKRNRIKTGTNQEKALLIFIIFLLVPTILLGTGFLSIGALYGDQNSIFASGEVSGVPLNNLNKEVNEHMNLNFQINSNTNKNITIHKASENETNILIKDIEPGG